MDQHEILMRKAFLNLANRKVGWTNCLDFFLVDHLPKDIGAGEGT